MGRFLIAGAAGYTGARLAAHLLAQGHSVRGLVRDPETDVVQDLAAQGMAVWEGDLTQPETLLGIANGIEYVYNLTSGSILSTDNTRRLLIDGNRNLIAACSRARSVRSYVMAGNIAAYGDHGSAWVGEEAAVQPCYPLGEVMVAAERAVMELIQQHHFPAIILRIGRIYGPWRDPVEAAQHGSIAMIGDGRNYLPHIHVDDLVQCLETIALHGQPGAIYNVGDQEPVQAQQLYDTIYEQLGLPTPQLISPENARRAGLDESLIGMAASSVRLDTTRLVQELGVTLRYPSLLDWITQPDLVVTEAGSSESLVFAD